MRAEYDFASMKGGVRGKYAGRAREGTNIIVLSPGVADTARSTTRAERKTKSRKPARKARS